MCHRIMVLARINESSNPLDLGHRYVLDVALYAGSIDKGSFSRSILETRILLNKGM